MVTSEEPRLPLGVITRKPVDKPGSTIPLSKQSKQNVANAKGKWNSIWFQLWIISYESLVMSHFEFLCQEKTAEKKAQKSVITLFNLIGDDPLPGDYP